MKEDYKSILQDIFDSEELKIDSYVVQQNSMAKLWTEQNDKFKKCFMKVCN